MKKYYLIILSFFVSGCFATHSEQVYEPTSTLTIQIPDETYAKNLKEAWRRQYPEWENLIEIEVESYAFTQSLEADIVWTNDLDVRYILGKLYEFENVSFAYDYEEDTIREELTSIFVPVVAEGSLFFYDASKTDPIEDFKDMEEGVYHHSRAMESTFPFFVQCFEENGIVSMNALMDVDKMKEALATYKSLYTTLSWSDDINRNDALLYKASYGLYNNNLWSEEEDTSIHVQKMPSLYGEEVSPFMITYGFAIQKDCVDTTFAEIFLSFVRSYEGLQALIDSKYQVALIQQEEVKDFSIYERTYQEMIHYMQESRLYPDVNIQEKPSLNLYKFWLRSNVTSILQNYICGNLSETKVVKQIQEELTQWVYRQ